MDMARDEDEPEMAFTFATNSSEPHTVGSVSPGSPGVAYNCHGIGRLDVWGYPSGPYFCAFG